MTSINDERENSQTVNCKRKCSLNPLLRYAERSHSRLPVLRKIPLRALGIIGVIALLNAAVWIATSIVLVSWRDKLIARIEDHC